MKFGFLLLALSFSVYAKPKYYCPWGYVYYNNGKTTGCERTSVRQMETACPAGAAAYSRPLEEGKFANGCAIEIGDELSGEIIKEIDPEENKPSEITGAVTDLSNPNN